MGEVPRHGDSLAQNGFPVPDRRSRSPFLWGVATSAYQIEGAVENDWTAWESAGRLRIAGAQSARRQPRGRLRAWLEENPEQMAKYREFLR